jgi:hypothetical protein
MKLLSVTAMLALHQHRQRRANRSRHNGLVQNFRESRTGKEEEEEEEGNDIVIEEEKCRVKTYQDAVKSLRELQEFALQRNDSDIISVISQAKLFVES